MHILHCHIFSCSIAWSFSRDLDITGEPEIFATLRPPLCNGLHHLTQYISGGGYDIYIHTHTHIYIYIYIYIYERAWNSENWFLSCLELPFRTAESGNFKKKMSVKEQDGHIFIHIYLYIYIWPSWTYIVRNFISFHAVDVFQICFSENVFQIGKCFPNHKNFIQIYF